MKTRRIIALAAIVPLVAGVGAADAATKKKKPAPKKPTCNLVTDAKADATDTGGTGATAPDDPTFDIVSADVATDATRLTVAVRLTSVDFASSTWKTGHAFVFSFTAGGKNIDLRGIVSPAGNNFAKGKGTGTVDTAKKEVRFTLPLAELGVPVKPNDKLTELRAASWRWVGTTEATLGTVDKAASAASYPASWPSCVKVGV